MKIPNLQPRSRVFAAAILILPFMFTACATLTPEEQRAHREEIIKKDMQRTDIQLIRPFAATGGKFGSLPENGEFSVIGWPCALYFGDKMIALVSEVIMGLKAERRIIGTFSAEEIREVKRARSVDGYEAVILSYDDNISYYIIPWNMAELSPFGEITTFTSDVQDKGGRSADRIAQLLRPKVQPRPADAPPQLIDKHPSQFLKEAKTVEGILQKGWNGMEIDGKSISLVLEIRDGLQLIGFCAAKSKSALNYREKIALEAALSPIQPGRSGVEMEGKAYAVTIVHAKDGSWRYRVQIPEPIQ